MKTSYDKGTNVNGYHDKNLSIVNITKQSQDIEVMKKIIEAYYESSSINTKYITINHIKFCYEEIDLSDNPPFLVPSFVKLDSLTKVNHGEWDKLRNLNSGNPLDRNELSRIKNLLNS